MASEGSMVKRSGVTCCALVMLLLLCLTPYSPLPAAARPAALDSASIHFLQFQGPPALSRAPDGKWVNKSPFFCLSISTAAYHHLNLGILGPAVQIKDEKGGKGPALLAHLSQIPDGSLVVFYDAQDVFVLRDTSAVLEAADTFDLTDTIVFAAERNCWRYQYCQAYPPAPTSYRYLNSGALLARNGPHFRAFIESWSNCITAKVDDQNCVHWWYHGHPDGNKYKRGASFKVTLDHHCRLFQTGWGTKIENPRGPENRTFQALDGDLPWVEHGVLTNPETQTHPCFLHFNGGKKYMGHYFDLLFPDLSWDHPRMTNVEFVVWGRRTSAAEFCTV